MKKYKCTVCGYVYDPEKGIPPGNPFEKLPEYYKCPVCGFPEEKYVSLEEN